MQQYYDQYHTTQVSTTDRVKIVLMLYERAIALTKKTGEQILAKNFVGKAESISKLLAIISGLMDALDFDQGKEIAVNFQKLYQFMFDQLLVLNRRANPQKADLKPLAVVLQILIDMKEGWEHVVKEHHAPPDQTTLAKQHLFHVVVR